MLNMYTYIDIYYTNILHKSPIHTETMLRMHHVHNGMLNHYKCILVGCFKEIFQGVPAVLQALKELNFILANKALELSAHYSFPLEPH